MQITQEANGLYTIGQSNKEIQSPFFFPAISTIKTNYEFSEYLKILKEYRYQGFLFSAYDIYNSPNKDKLIKEISGISNTKTFTLMDSGNYESYWNKDTKWTFKEFESVLQEILVDVCFSFDVYWNSASKVKQQIQDTNKFTAMTAGVQKLGTTIPIIHSIPEKFPDVIKGVVEGINPQIIGITERELGFSLLERATNLRTIRTNLDEFRKGIPIHLLGAGNPTSLLVYSLCGANFFDALEWCKNVVNPKNGHLYHFIQKELITCDCKACKLKQLGYQLQTITHNLIFYEKFMEEIRVCIRENKSEDLLKKYLPLHFAPSIKKLIL